MTDDTIATVLAQHDTQEYLARLLRQTEQERDQARRENAYLREWLRGELTIADADIDAMLKKAGLS